MTRRTCDQNHGQNPTVTSEDLSNGASFLRLILNNCHNRCLDPLAIGSQRAFLCQRHPSVRVTRLLLPTIWYNAVVSQPTLTSS